MEKNIPQGLLLVDKPSGWTSFDVVGKIRSIIAKELNIKPKKVKVGHGGTLDPAATGLLVLAIGSATRQISLFSKADKTYEVGATLGITSNTGDTEGDLTINDSVQPVTKQQLEASLARHTGEIEQRPHPFSAVKINGVRSYKLARLGKKVENEAKRVTVLSITLKRYDWPQFDFDTEVSSGTYIRTLVEDIGKDLGLGAYTTSLRRTKVGDFNIEDSLGIEDFVYKSITQRLLTID